MLELDSELITATKGIETMLFKLHLSRHVSGMVSGPVDSVPADGILFAIDENGNQVIPNKEAIRECLPHYYRKSFDKSAQSQNGYTDDIFHFHLYDSKHKYMNTVYCIGYKAKPPLDMSSKASEARMTLQHYRSDMMSFHLLSQSKESLLDKALSGEGSDFVQKACIDIACAKEILGLN